MDKKYAEYLVNKTREDYNLIANDYTRTRAFIPEDIKMMADYTVGGDKVLDCGCASGRFFGVLKPKNIEYFGIDISEQLIEIAKQSYSDGRFQVVNALNLSFPDNYFDKVFSISVLHNIPSKEFRAKYLKEIYRVLKPGGLLILRVWDFWKRKKGLTLLIKYAFLKMFGKSQMDFKDIFYPWKNQSGKVIAQRYFHCFTKREMDKLFREAGFKIEKSWVTGKGKLSNIYIVGQK